MGHGGKVSVCGAQELLRRVYMASGRILTTGADRFARFPGSGCGTAFAALSVT